MHKKFLLKGLAAITILANFISPLSVSAAPPVYRSNVLEEVMITRIIPAESYMEMTYNSLGIRSDDARPTYSNIQYGDITDYQLYMLGMGKYSNTTIIARGTHMAMYLWPSFESGETRELIKGKQIKNNVDLTKNTSNKFFYTVTFIDQPQFSRVDYSRCVESEVFKAGLATECRMEIKSNGLVQYQPYSSDGVRMELTPEEDALLTEATESWRAEPGDWGPEWYIEPTTDDDTGDGGGDDSGGDDGDDGGDGDDDDDDGGGDDGDGGDGNDDSDSGDEIGDGDDNTDNSDSATDVGNVENNTDTNNAVANTSNEGSNSGTTSAQIAFTFTNPSRSSGFAYWIPGETGSASSSIVISDNTDTDNSDNKGNTQSKQNETSDLSDNNNSAAGEGVAVPELGKEEGQMPNWPAIFSIIGAAAAGLVCWWFLFFGRKKTKEEKGEEK